MQTIRTPAYVERFDALDFPGVEVHTSSLETPLVHERVDLIKHEHTMRCVAACEFEWDVVRGDHRVALALVNAEIAHNLGVVEQEIGKWITEQKERNSADRSWRQRWHDRLSEIPAVEQWLAKGTEELFTRAGLTYNELRAIRLHEEGKSRREIGLALGITGDAVDGRLNSALTRLRTLGS
jgi:predicted DNA-binding protein (UPF0251 family)